MDMNHERTFIIGDIHGCLDLLKRLMDKIDWRPKKDQLIFLGDYIDRGENSKGVVDYILALKRASSNVKCLLGNHEAIFINYLAGQDQEIFFMNGGMPTLRSYQANRSGGSEGLFPQEHVDFMQTLSLYIELEDYYVVHAGFRPDVDIKDQTLEDILWIRDAFIYNPCHIGKKVIFGHTPFYEPLILKDKIGLDTGAVYGNKLTCLELPEMRFHFVKAF